MRTQRFIVIGGGITGLAAAHRLVELAQSHQMEIDLRLLEASDRVGGVIHTIHQDGCLIEAGPDSFITKKPWAIDLSNRLNIPDQLLSTNAAHRRAMVVHRGKLLPVPPGFLLTAPTQVWPIICSPLISLSGKLRMAIEPFIPAGKGADESLSSFVTRRFGKQLLDRLVQPLVGGIYTADPDQLSVRATLPEFLEKEAQFGRITLAMIQEAKTRATQSGARYSLFATFRNGMQTLVDALFKHIGPSRIQLNNPVQSVSKSSHGSWMVKLQNGTELDADGVVLSTPAHVEAKILISLDPPLGQQLATIRHASSAVVNLVYQEKDLIEPLDAFGFVVPAIEKLNILAVSYSSVKYAHRAPKDRVLLRAFVGGALQPQLLNLDDAAIIDLVCDDLQRLLGIRLRSPYHQTMF